jgi:hypothetical protein
MLYLAYFQRKQTLNKCVYFYKISIATTDISVSPTQQLSNMYKNDDKGARFTSHKNVIPVNGQI